MMLVITTTATICSQVPKGVHTSGARHCGAERDQQPGGARDRENTVVTSTVRSLTILILLIPIAVLTLMVTTMMRDGDQSQNHRHTASRLVFHQGLMAEQQDAPVFQQLGLLLAKKSASLQVLVQQALLLPLPCRLSLGRRLDPLPPPCLPFEPCLVIVCLQRDNSICPLCTISESC